MAMSGVLTDPCCTDLFNIQKLGLKGPGGLKKDISYICFRISADEKLIEPESIVMKSGKKITLNECDLKNKNKVEEFLNECRGGDEQTAEVRWMTFKEDLPAKECRYYTYDFHYKSKSGQQNEKLCFVTWAPDEAPIKKKMMIASSKEGLKKTFVGISHDIQANDQDGLLFTTVTENVSNTK